MANSNLPRRIIKVRFPISLSCQLIGTYDLTFSCLLGSGRKLNGCLVNRVSSHRFVISLLILKLNLGILVVCVGAAPGISASPSEENMRYFNVMILGPTQSPYEGTQSSFSQVSLYRMDDQLIN